MKIKLKNRSGLPERSIPLKGPIEVDFKLPKLARVGLFIKRVRKSKKIRQTALCKKVGCSQGRFSKLEHGRLVPSAILWLKICKELRIDPWIIIK